MNAEALRALVAAAALVVASLVLVPLQLLALHIRWQTVLTRLPRLWHRVAARLIGMRILCRGKPATARPLLLVANHQSWADILALGSVLDLAFIAKAEVRSWPVFGFLARLQRTVFVERDARSRTGEQADAIADRLGAGDVMVLFAEGTTSDGNGVLPFKSALIGAAQSAVRRSSVEAVLVQPVSVAFVRLHGLPLGRSGRPWAAWPGDVELLPHLRSFLRRGAFDVEITFGEPIEVSATSNRKAVTRACEASVARLLAESLSGRG